MVSFIVIIIILIIRLSSFLFFFFFKIFTFETEVLQVHMGKQYMITVESEDNLVRKFLHLSANAEALITICCRAQRNGN